MPTLHGFSRELSPLMADFFHSMTGRDGAVKWARGKLEAQETGCVEKNATLVLRRLNESLARLDFAGHDLRGKDFTNVDWRGADLRGANLEGATLVGANLGGGESGGSAPLPSESHECEFDGREACAG